MSVMGIGLVAKKDKEIERLKQELLDMASTLKNVQKEHSECYSLKEELQKKVEVLEKQSAKSDKYLADYSNEVKKLKKELEEVSYKPDPWVISKESSVFMDTKAELEKAISDKKNLKKDLDAAVAKVNELLQEKENFWLTEERLRRAEKSLEGYREDRQKDHDNIVSLKAAISRMRDFITEEVEKAL